MLYKTEQQIIGLNLLIENNILKETNNYTIQKLEVGMSKIILDKGE
jgi:hypothetical protein